jgi:hypothetical protein
VVEKHVLLGLKPNVESKLYMLECLINSPDKLHNTPDKISWYYNDLFKEYDNANKFRNKDEKRVMFYVYDKMFIMCQNTNNLSYAITLFHEMLAKKISSKFQNRTVIENFKLCFKNENEKLVKFMEGLNDEDRKAYFSTKYQKDI